MIVTFTLNPSVDISYSLCHFALNDTNRAKKIQKTAGGKGLNVARIIKLANEQVIASGFLGGFLGEFIKAELNKEQINFQFFPIAQESRNCIAILHEGNQTEILESGPTITDQEQQNFISLFVNLIKKNDVITFSGSLPKGIPDNYYAHLIQITHEHQNKVLLDCSGAALKQTIIASHKPYLIKPNHSELADLLGIKIESTNFNLIVNLLQNEPLLKKIPCVLVSLGKHGAIAKIHNQIWRASIPTIEVINPVGSGDATLAGLAIGIKNQDPTPILLKRAMAFGMLNAKNEKTGAIDLHDYSALFNAINVELYQ